MRVPVARLNRLLAEARRRAARRDLPRIHSIVVEMPADDDHPLGEERLVMPGVGVRPALYEVGVPWPN